MSLSSTLTIMVGSSGFIIGLLITLITVARSKESKCKVLNSYPLRSKYPLKIN